LQKHGFTHDVLRERLICFASDGASVTVVITAGVLTWHCANHRLELASGDAVNDIRAVSNFKIFLDKLYFLYSCSPKNRAELEVAAADVNEQVRKIGRVLDTRWVSSSFNTVTAVIVSYRSLAEHFPRSSEDKNRDSREKAKFIGLLTLLTAIYSFCIEPFSYGRRSSGT
jgi:hypothetical protein